MQTTSKGSPATSKFSAMLDTLLSISTALGTLREHQRLHEIRLTSMEARFDTLTTIWMRSAPRPCTPPTKTTPITPPSTATLAPEQADTVTATTSLLKRAAHKLGPEALIWGLGKLWAAAYPLLLPGIAFLGAIMWKWVGPWIEPLWRFLTSWIGLLWKFATGWMG